MDSRKLVFSETKVILIGEVAGVLLMYGVYALLGRMGAKALLGGLAGGVLAVANFFFMAVGATQAADKAAGQDVKGGKALMRLSYGTRLALIFVILFACVKSGLCDPIACVLPLLFVRATIYIADFLRKGKDKK